MQDEEPGLYAPDYAERVAAEVPSLRHIRLSTFNHYTLVVSERGARVLAEMIEAEMGGYAAETSPEELSAGWVRS